MQQTFNRLFPADTQRQDDVESAAMPAKQVLPGDVAEMSGTGPERSCSTTGYQEER
jgi:hypothetical protein